MSYIVTPFEVVAKALAAPLKCRFVHLYAAIATRHSDTIDCVFLVDGHTVTVAISCAAISALRDHDRRPLTDQQLAEIAARFLRETLEAGNNPEQGEISVDEGKLREMVKELGYV